MNYLVFLITAAGIFLIVESSSHNLKDVACRYQKENNKKHRKLDRVFTYNRKNPKRYPRCNWIKKAALPFLICFL